MTVKEIVSMKKQYKSVDDMINHLAGWKFKIKWYWGKFVKLLRGKK